MDLRRLGTDLLALCLLALCVFLTLCLWSYDPADPPSHLVLSRSHRTAERAAGPTER